MFRTTLENLGISSLGLAAALVVARPASADECICFEPERLEAERAELEGLESQLDELLGSGELFGLSSDHLSSWAASSWSTAGWPLLESEAFEAAARASARMEHARIEAENAPAAGARRRGPLLWCASADDTRCAPVIPGTSGGSASSVGDAGTAAIVIPTHDPRIPKLTAGPKGHERGGPRPGHAHRIERPPRRV